MKPLIIVSLILTSISPFKRTSKISFENDKFIIDNHIFQYAQVYAIDTILHELEIDSNDIAINYPFMYVKSKSIGFVTLENELNTIYIYINPGYTRDPGDVQNHFFIKRRSKYNVEILGMPINSATKINDLKAKFKDQIVLHGNIYILTTENFTVDFYAFINGKISYITIRV
jgi:hypothetical protein